MLKILFSPREKQCSCCQFVQHSSDMKDFFHSLGKGVASISFLPLLIFSLAYKKDPRDKKMIEVIVELRKLDYCLAHIPSSAHLVKLHTSIVQPESRSSEVGI